MRIILAIGAVAGLAWAGAAQEHHERVVSRIALGSCANENEPCPAFGQIADADPDVFLMLGDNVYGDTEDMDVLRAKYAKLGDNPGFRAIKRTADVIAVWDDHDFGVNDGGREYPMRAESQEVFCDFFGVGQDSPRRTTPGIYGSVTYGPPGRRVQFILLDTRYFRSPLTPWPKEEQPPRAFGVWGRYAPEWSSGVTMLGPDQWRWLEGVLREPADLRIIASSIQVVALDHRWEGWGTMPRERRRLMDLIDRADAGGVVFVSGDRHRAELSRLDPRIDEPGAFANVGYPLYDLTASSLNRGRDTFNNEINRHRVGSLYGPDNFGWIEIDWDGPDGPVVSLQIRSDEGETVIRADVALSELQG